MSTGACSVCVERTSKSAAPSRRTNQSVPRTQPVSTPGGAEAPSSTNTTSGLGYLIQQAGSYLNTALVLSGIICIALIALALDACIRGLLLLADPSRRG